MAIEASSEDDEIAEMFDDLATALALVDWLAYSPSICGSIVYCAVSVTTCEQQQASSGVLYRLNNCSNAPEYCESLLHS